MIVLLAAWGCWDGPTVADMGPVKEGAASTVSTDREAPAVGMVNSALPVACEDPILVPEAGYLVVEDVLADPSAPILGGEPIPARVHLGMHAWGREGGAIGWIWTTDAATMATELEIRVASGESLRLPGASFTLFNDPELRRVHEARACGLKPGAQIEYRVGGAGAGPDGAEGEAWSAWTPLRLPGSAEVTVAAVGDSRDNPAVWAQVMASIDEADPDLILMTGDMVGSGSNIAEWWEWLDAAGEPLARRPLIGAHGNHEALAQGWFGVMALPGNEQWFSLDIGPAHVVVINDSGLYNDVATQQAWLREDLAANTNRWTITVHHQPAYSSSTVHAISTLYLDNFVPILDEYDVDLDLAGHNHHYERMLPMRDSQITPGGTLYVVTAGGGAPLYANYGTAPYSAKVAVTEHFTLLRIGPGSISAEAIDVVGNVLDRWELR